MNQSKAKLYYIFLLAVVSVIAMVTATYAWLNISRLPSVSDISLSLITENSVLIAEDIDGEPGEWNSFLDMSAILEDMNPLEPVTYSAVDDQIYSINYGDDGRPAGLNTTDSAEEYYITVTFWLQSSSTATDIQLAEPTEDVNSDMGGGTYVVGEPIWNSSTISHDNGGNGGETTIRIGFECQETDLEYNPVGESTFFIYEPNADVHVDESTGYEATSSTDGTSTLVGDEYLIIQNSSSWSESDPVLQDNVIYDMGEFQQNQTLFTLDSDSLMKITMYIWMEGQDVDCSNMAVAKESLLLANIQFTNGGEDSEEIDTGITAR